MKWTKTLPDFFTRQWNRWFRKVEEALVLYFTPPFVAKSNDFFAPVIALLGLITAIAMVGLAVGSFFTLFTSLLVLYFILTKIFGIQLDTGDVFVV